MSANPALRRLDTGLAFWIGTLWVWLKLRYGSDGHRGKQRRHPRRFTLKRLCYGLCRAITKKRPGGHVDSPGRRIQNVEQMRSGRLVLIF